MQHLYVVVRQDMPIAHQAVQAVHAGISAARELIPAEVIHPSLVLCSVKDRDELLAVSDQLIGAGIVHRIFREDDMGGQPTALATEPVGKEGRKVFRKLKLFEAA